MSGRPIMVVYPKKARFLSIDMILLLTVVIHMSDRLAWSTLQSGQPALKNIPFLVRFHISPPKAGTKVQPITTFTIVAMTPQDMDVHTRKILNIRHPRLNRRLPEIGQYAGKISLRILKMR